MTTNNFFINSTITGCAFIQGQQLHGHSQLIIKYIQRRPKRNGQIPTKKVVKKWSKLLNEAGQRQTMFVESSLDILESIFNYNDYQRKLIKECRDLCSNGCIDGFHQLLVQLASTRYHKRLCQAFRKLKSYNKNVIDCDNDDIRGYLIRIDLNGNHLNTYILTQETTTIGRKKDNKIVLIDQTVSSKHAEIEIDANKKSAFIVDLNSTNKTRIGQQLPSQTYSNKKIKPNRECIVNSADYVTFGDVHFMFYFEDDYDRLQQQRQLQTQQNYNNNNNNNDNNNNMNESLSPNNKKRRSLLSKTHSFHEGDDEQTKKMKDIKKKKGGRGRKRTVQERDEDDTNNKEEEEDEAIRPPTKRQRCSVSKKKESSSDESNVENGNRNNNGLRRSKRKTTTISSSNTGVKKKKSSNIPIQRSNRLQTKSDDDDESKNDKKVILLRTGTNNPAQNKQLEDLGAIVLNEYDDTVTHIISSQPRRTLKFISGMATSQHIVTDQWLTICVKKGTLNIDEKKYFPSNQATKEFEKKYGFKLKKSFKKLKERKEPLFDGYKVYFTKEHKANVKEAIGTMAESHGAALMSQIPKATASGAIESDIIVIGIDKNHKHCKAVESEGYIIYNRDIIITSILRQDIDLQNVLLMLEDEEY